MICPFFVCWHVGSHNDDDRFATVSDNKNIVNLVHVNSKFFLASDTKCGRHGEAT
jgi:hypothetical protein